MAFFAELQRRNVIRVAGLYLVGAWLMVQVASTLLPMFDAPAWTPRAVVILLALGMVPALLFSWVYELTPDGLKRESQIDRSESITATTAQRIEHAIVVVLALALMVFAFDKFVLAPREKAALVQANAAELAKVRTQAAKSESTNPASRPIPTIEADPSIAVLPFLNLSKDEDQQYFSDGISEELLDVLAQVPELRVIARTSSFAFRDGKAGTDEIARKLHVAALLQGSVRKAGNTVRIGVQLVRANDGRQLWSETYDRSLDDIFKVQDEIAANVVEKLKLSLLGGAPTVRPVDPRIYPMILQAQALSDQGSSASYRQAAKLFKQATAIVPDEPRAWSGVGLIYLNQLITGELPPEEAIRLTREALQRAQALDPTDASTTSRLAYLAQITGQGLQAAAALHEKALARDPNSYRVIGNAAVFLAAAGRIDDSLALGERAMGLDPANAVAYSNQGTQLIFAGRWDEAIADFRTALSLSPDFSQVHYLIGSALLFGKHDAAGALAEFQAEPDPLVRGTGLPIALHALGRKAEADAALADLIAKHSREGACLIAYVYAQTGDADQAFAWLEKAIVQQDPNLSTLYVEPAAMPLRRDPRWLPLLRKLGQAPEQLAKIRFKMPAAPQTAAR